MKIEIPDEFFNKEELENTPRRVQKFYDELKTKHDFNFTCFPNEEPHTKGMVILRNIKYTSLCSHHLLPFTGVAHVGYVPNDIRCGLSKLSRTVDKFASKPNVQEVLTYEITEFLQEQIKPLGIICVIFGKHACLGCRGANKDTSEMITSEVRGVFLKHEVGKDPKLEFFSLIGLINGK